jgi:hypothetical protein
MGATQLDEDVPGGDGQACSGAEAASSGFAAAGLGTAKPLSHVARTGMMAEWLMMAARRLSPEGHSQFRGK